MQISDLWGAKLRFAPVLSMLGSGDIQAAAVSEEELCPARIFNFKTPQQPAAPGQMVALLGILLKSIFS